MTKHARKDGAEIHCDEAGTSSNCQHGQGYASAGKMNWKARGTGVFAAKVQLKKLSAAVPLVSTFLIVAVLMAFYELLKEIFFDGNLTLWESHTITVFVTSTFATVAAFYVRKNANKLMQFAQNEQIKADGVVKSIFDGIVTIDSKGIIQAFNPAAERIFGYKAEKITGRNVKILMPEPYSGGNDSYLQNYLLSNNSKILGKSNRNLSGRRANGDIFPIDLMVSKTIINNKPIFIGVIRDISDYKNAELELIRLREVERQTLINLQNELSIAAAIQMNVIPKSTYLFPQHPQIQAYGLMRPAKEIGGDFFDAFPIDTSHVVFAIGDVSGKGIPAALFMMATMALLKAKIKKPKNFGAAITSINKLLCKNNDANMFVSLFVGLLNVETGELQYINCGHNPPLFASRSDQFRPLNVPMNILLGIHEGAKYEVENLQLQLGDTLVLYTDGVTEAENSHGEFFSRGRATQVLTSTYLDAKILVHGLFNEITDFCDTHPQSDDITIFALQYNSNSALGDSTRFFEWTDALSVGVTEIDDQHKMLIYLINKMYEEIIKRDANAQAVDELLILFLQYMKTHFCFEEALMSKFAYSDIESHKAYHANLQKRVIQIQQRKSDSQAFVDTELLGFLKKWLEHHVMIEDQRAFLEFGDVLESFVL